MYRLYKTKCVELNRMPVKLSMYRSMFDNDFNLAFHTPRKDACDTCAVYNAALKTNSLTEEQQIEQDSHIMRKEQARDAKLKDKNCSPKDTVAAAFDLEQVLVCPKLTVSSAYYLRKLNVYNLTVLELKTLQGFCFTWDKSEGRRGSNEIGSSLWKWLKEVDQRKWFEEVDQVKMERRIERVILYSDTCGGQNRNRNIYTAIAYFLSMSANIDIIEQKFFESGHSQSECDSMHSKIEAQLQKRSVYIPWQYSCEMKCAVIVRPYKTSELKHADFLNFEDVNSRVVKITAFSGIQSVHHIVYEKTDKVIKISFVNEIGGPLTVTAFPDGCTTWFHKLI